MNPSRTQMGVGCWIEYSSKCVWCVTFSYSTQSHNAQSPLAHHPGRGRFLFSIWKIYPIGICFLFVLRLAPKSELTGCQGGMEYRTAPYYQKSADMPRKPLYWLFTSLLYCMWEQQTALSPGASLSTELREFGKSVVCAMQTKRKAPKPNE